MNTNKEKSLLYFLNDLIFCISEMRGYYKPEELVIRVTPEAQNRIYEALFGDAKNYRPKYICGIELVVVENIDGSSNFDIIKKTEL